MVKGEKSDDELIKAVMEDNEPEVEWIPEIEDVDYSSNEGYTKASHPGWIIRIIDVAILVIFVIIGFLMFRGF